MRTILLVIILSLFVSTAGYTGKPDRTFYSSAPVTRASLFKNGLALVDRTVEIPPHKNVIIIKDNPVPVHGTFWVNSRDDVDFTFTRLKVVDEKPKELNIKDLFKQMPGTEVTVYFKNNTSVHGRITGKGVQGVSYITLQTGKGTEFIDNREIWRFTVHGPKVRIQKQHHYKEIPAIKIRVKPSGKKRSLQFGYLTYGLTWAPSYKLNLAPKDRATLSFKAVLKNELVDLNNCDVRVISGFPAIRFQNVVSPLSVDTAIRSFLGSLSVSDRTYQYRREVIAQNVRIGPNNSFNDRGHSDDPVSVKSDLDIHVQKLGRLSINKGEARLVTIGSRQVTTERIVEWHINNNRNMYGHYVNAGSGDTQDVWDAIIFKNRFAFPMTTAPAAIYRDEQFLSQNISYWTAPGQKSTVRFTKALNISVRYLENEKTGSRKRTYVHGRSYQKSIINGQLFIVNRRSRTVKMVIKKDLYGTVIKAGNSPQKQLLPDGAYSVNKQNRLIWTVKCKPGEKVTIDYSYSVLVNI